MKFEIRDIKSAPSGKQKIDWVKAHMPLLNKIEEDFKRDKPFSGLKISLSIHLEAKTAYLCQVLAAGGAEMSITGSNTLSTQDDVCAALVESGLSVFAFHGATEEEYFRHIKMCLSDKPNIIIDDGGDLTGYLHLKEPDLTSEVMGGCEETTTGILRLKAMEKEGVLMFPMIAVNDAKCKHLFDNRYGTGQSVFDGIMRNTNLLVAGKTVVVSGYGWCGKGISMRAKALGAKVIVTEIEPVAALEAVMDGFAVMPMDEAAPLGDFFISSTGNIDVISYEHMLKMKNLAILANAGHFDVEISMKELNEKALSKENLKPNIDGYKLENGNTICVMAQGKLVNIAAADGHPAEVMDMSFAVQSLSALYIKEHYKELENRLIDVSDEIDDMIAKRLLLANGITIDTLTKSQEEYLGSWKFV